jgi:hypothetical protein
MIMLFSGGVEPRRLGFGPRTIAEIDILSTAGLHHCTTHERESIVSRPKTNAEGFALVLSKISKNQLAKSLVSEKKPNGLSRQALTKWTEVPIEYVPQVSKITGVPREMILPEVFGK